MQNSIPNKILLTGGHAASTAYAVIEEIRLRKPDSAIYWIGSKYSMEGKSDLSLEFEFFKKYYVKSYPIIMGRIQRRFSVWTIPSLAKIPVGFIKALFLLLKIKPDIV